MKNTITLLGRLLLVLIVPLFFNQAKATPLSATITSSTNVFCNGGSNGNATVTASGGVSPYTYLWSTNPTQATVTATGLTAGTYTVVVADASFATATATVTITQPAVFTTLINLSSPLLCNGGNGCIQAMVAGGTYPYSFIWSPGGNTNATDCFIPAGTYTVNAIDANGCTASAAYTLTQPPILTATASVLSNATCNGSYTGAVTSTVTGGTSPYTYVWAPTGGTNFSASGLQAGCYTLSVTDVNGCTAATITCITQPTAISIVSTYTNDTGSCSGTATVSTSGGTPPYTYLWSPGGYTNSSISNLCAGTYCCTVYDSAGCTDSACVTISTCSNNFDEPICIVTLDTATNKCEVVWGRTNSPPSGGYGHYNIYRDTGLGYTLIQSQALNVLSEYVDATSDPSSGPVSYKLSTFDSCGESALSSPHTSIYLTTTAALNVYILNWTAYIGFTPTKYIIYRGPSLGNLTAIDSVPNSVLTYHDTLPPLGSYYVVEGVSPSGPCVPSMHSANKVSSLSGAFSNGFNTGALLGINNPGGDISKLNIYPNPSNGLFTLSYSITGSENISISILNELGQEIYMEQKHSNAGPNTEQLNIGNLASGIYTLRMQTNAGISVRKLLIMPNR